MVVEYISIEDNTFVGHVFDLSQSVHLELLWGKDIKHEPDKIYVYNVDFRINNLFNLVIGLSKIYTLLKYNSFPIKNSYGSIPRGKWLYIVWEIFLTRVSSVRDCIFFLICDIYEIEYNNVFEVNRKFLYNNPLIDSKIKKSINDIANIAKEIRDERNEMIHQGMKRSMYDAMFYTISCFEAMDIQVDAPCNYIEEYNDIIIKLESIIDKTYTQVEQELNKILNYLYQVFLKAFRKKREYTRSKE